jgi:repressor LexA
MFLPLTKRQREILDFLIESIDRQGYAPSLEEIGRRFQLSSLATVHKHLENLKEKGYITRGWNRSRHITVLMPGNHCPTCGRMLETVGENLVESA